MQAVSIVETFPVQFDRGFRCRNPRTVGRARFFWEPNDLARIAADLLEQARQQDRCARRAIIAEPGLHAVLVALPAPMFVREERLNGPASLQVVQGGIRLHRPGGTVDLGSGQLLALKSDVAFAVEAQTDSAYLLTITGTEGPSIEAERGTADIGEPW